MYPVASSKSNLSAATANDYCSELLRLKHYLLLLLAELLLLLTKQLLMLIKE